MSPLHVPLGFWSGAVAILLLLTACGNPLDRPVRGVLPGAPHLTPTPGVPPTLGPTDPRFLVLPSPSPGVTNVTPVASPSPNPAPPIVRTIQPTGGAVVPPGQPVTVSAVLVGRGAILASATLTIDGADAGAETQKTSATQWTVRATKTLPEGAHTARVQVRDETGAAGGFTWQFSVGNPTPTPAPSPENPEPEKQATPAPSPKPDGDG